MEFIYEMLVLSNFVQLWNNGFSQTCTSTHWYMWCDQAEWVGNRTYWFWDIANRKEQIPLFSIVLQNFQLLVSVEPTNFHEVFYLMWLWECLIQLCKKTKKCYLYDLTTHFAWLHYIYEELVSKTSYIHPRHDTHLYYWLPFAIKIVQIS